VGENVMQEAVNFSVSGMSCARRQWLSIDRIIRGASVGYDSGDLVAAALVARE
jgi:hypothetical protein